MNVMVAVLVALLGGCTRLTPAPLAGGPLIARVPFAHDELAAVLERFVDDAGQVSYAALQADPVHLERYCFLLAHYSPDSHPEFFPTEADRLAYWINAYNAAVLKAVVRHYPIASVTDVAPPVPLRFMLPRESGFFVFQRITLGGDGTSLYWLEQRVIRRRFADPRVHFVLNCASRGCPRLLRRPLTARRLEEQLERAAREFVAEERNVRVDDEARVVQLSAIFDWYEKDFRRALEEDGADGVDARPMVLDYVARYAPEATAAALRRAADYELRFVPYDWRLNDRSAAEPAGPGAGAPPATSPTTPTTPATKSASFPPIAGSTLTPGGSPP